MDGKKGREKKRKGGMEGNTNEKEEEAKEWRRRGKD